MGGGGHAEGGACRRTNDHVGLRVSKGTAVLDCDTAQWPNLGDAGPPKTIVVEGRVTDTAASSFTVDSCPPFADCLPSLTKVDILDAPTNTVSSLAKDDLVRIEYGITRFWACQQSLEVTALASWGGATSPRPAGMLLLAVADGGAPFPDSPYTVDRVLLDCDPDAGRGCGTVEPGDYTFSFAPKGAPDQAVRVDMGETGLTQIQLGNESGVVAHNLRSYQSEACDDYWNFAYVLSAEPLPR